MIKDAHSIPSKSASPGSASYKVHSEEWWRERKDRMHLGWRKRGGGKTDNSDVSIIEKGVPVLMKRSEVFYQGII